MTAAFFDLDRTLISVNSGLLWAQHERKTGNISNLQFARAAVWSVLYHLSLIDINKALDQAISHYRGVSHTEINERTRNWFFADVEHLLRDQAKRAVEDHKEQGHPVVILTSSSSFEARAAAETWGFDDFLSNQFPTDGDDRLTGTCARPICYGAGKVKHAEKWAAENDVDLATSYFYTDSYSDLPMLERVGEPRVVCPDPRLRRAARKRGWSVLDW